MKGQNNKIQAQENKLLNEITNKSYKYGFETKIEMEVAPKGINEGTVRFISAKKNEPEFLLNSRLKAFEHWKKMEFPGPISPRCFSKWKI